MTNGCFSSLFIICVVLITLNIGAFIIENKRSHRYVLFFLLIFLLLYLNDQLQLCRLSAAEIELSLDAILDKCNARIQFVKGSLTNEPSMPQLLKYDFALHQIDKMLSDLSPENGEQVDKIDRLRQYIVKLREKIANMAEANDNK